MFSSVARFVRSTPGFNARLKPKSGCFCLLTAHQGLLLTNGSEISSSIDMCRYYALTLFLWMTWSCSLCEAAEPSIERIDPAETQRILSASAKVESLAGGFQFIEGPVWMPQEGGVLVFSDIPANALKRWSPTGGVSLYRFPSKNANGNTLDLKGRLITAEHSGRRLSLTTKKENVKPLVEAYEGKRLNSPNDVVVKRDGSIWFTDPDYGLSKGETKELPGNYVYRFLEKEKLLTAVATDFDKPNGLCFSPDESKLYIADSGAPHHIRVFDVRPDGTLANSRVFCVIQPGGPDGIRCDVEGRVWSSAGNGVQVFSPAGSLIAKINLPETAANLCFGGEDGHSLFITARSTLYRVRTLTLGNSYLPTKEKKHSSDGTQR